MIILGEIEMTKINETILRVVQDEDGDTQVKIEDGVKEATEAAGVEDFTFIVADTLAKIAMEPWFPQAIKENLGKVVGGAEDAANS
jgi:hypothetical protein